MCGHGEETAVRMPRRQGSGGPALPPPGSGVQPPGRETADVCSVSSPICDACYSSLSKLLPHPGVSASLSWLPGLLFPARVSGTGCQRFCDDIIKILPNLGPIMLHPYSNKS